MHDVVTIVVHLIKGFSRPIKLLVGLFMVGIIIYDMKGKRSHEG